MVTLDDLKKNKNEILKNISNNEKGRDEIISLCSPVLDKRAYFTIDNFGKVKRKNYNYNLAATVFVDDNNDFLNFISEIIDFKEITKIEKIGRLTNAKDEELHKNIYKLLAKGELNYLLKPLKEIYMRSENKFFEILFNFTMMDNIFSKKTLCVYSLKKYFQKYGYSDEALFLCVSYLAKQRADFYEFENEKNLNNSTSKEELKEIIKNNLEQLRNEAGLTLLSYFIVLLQFNYENEKNYITILKNNLTKLLVSNNEYRKLNNIENEIFTGLSREV